MPRDEQRTEIIRAYGNERNKAGVSEVLINQLIACILLLLVLYTARIFLPAEFEQASELLNRWSNGDEALLIKKLCDALKNV